MEPFDLRSAIQRILAASLASGSLLAFAGCAASVRPSDGSVNDVVVPPDASPPDAPVPTDTAACAPIVSTSSVCSGQIEYPCGEPALVPGQPLDQAACNSRCAIAAPSPNTNPLSCNVVTTPSGTVALSCLYCAVGRRSDGLCEPDARAPGNVLGEYLANHATLEAASVIAFERLREELELHGAPPEILTALSRSADEERDHAERVGAMARRFGVVPQSVRIDLSAKRSLATIARENAVEGCVRETLGAVVAAFQANRAEDREIATMYRALAGDEARHAALSWKMDAWFATKLSARERAEIERARRDAIAALYESVGQETSAELERVTGLPPAAAARAMLEGLSREVWGGA